MCFIFLCIWVPYRFLGTPPIARGIPRRGGRQGGVFLRIPCARSDCRKFASAFACMQLRPVQLVLDGCCYARTAHILHSNRLLL